MAEAKDEDGTLRGDDLVRYQREAWDREVARGNRWTVPASAEEIARARRGELSLLLTPSRPVPKSWWPTLDGADVLCLASGGGQQAPVLAAAGARVVSFDNSPAQLERDREVAAREGLTLATRQGDMRDLGAFADSSFDLIFHPCSNCFVEDVLPVWRECFRVLRPGGLLLSGLCNPVGFLFDPALEKCGQLQLRFSAPYSDRDSLAPEERRALYGDEPLSFGHTLDDLVGGQLAAGFHLTGLFEDDWGGREPIDRHLKVFLSTRAWKPRT